MREKPWVNLQLAAGEHGIENWGKERFRAMVFEGHGRGHSSSSPIRKCDFYGSEMMVKCKTL